MARPQGGLGGTGRSIAAIALAVSMLVMGAGGPARAEEALSVEPILRIDTKLHGARFWRAATDTANRFLATASDDKTVRIWSLPEGRLLRVIRVPIDTGYLGKL